MLKSDLFISLDTVQYVPREWQNRQVFYDNGRYKWLSVPVNKGREPIKNKRIVNSNFLKDHWVYIKYIYRKSPYFNNYCKPLENIYLGARWKCLDDLCDAITILAKNILAIKTKFVRDSENGAPVRGATKADVLIDSINRPIDVRAYDEVIYLPRNYPIPNDFYINRKFCESKITEIEKFAQVGIKVQTYDFHHPTYRQFQNPEDTEFIPNLSIFDLIFNCGPESLKILKSGGNDEYRD